MSSAAMLQAKLHEVTSTMSRKIKDASGAAPEGAEECPWVKLAIYEFRRRIISWVFVGLGFFQRSSFCVD